MPAFTSSEDIRRYVGGIFETAFADPQLAEKLKQTGLVLKMVTTEPDSSMVIDLPNGTVSTADPDAAADATMTMSSETANGYWQGKVNLTMAMARGRVKVDGPVAKFVKLAPLSKKLFPVYIESLKNDGRDDLIIP